MSNTTIVDEDGAPGAAQNAIIIVMDDATGQTQEIDAATMQHLISSNPGAVNIVSIDQDSLQPAGASATVPAPAAPLPAPDPDLILDSEALDRLESALSSDEAREIFGDGLQIGGMGVNITGEEFPEELISIETEDAPDQSGDRARGGRGRGKFRKRVSGTRRSQRAADQSMRDLAQQIRAENLNRERQQQQTTNRGRGRGRGRGSGRGARGGAPANQRLQPLSRDGSVGRGRGARGAVQPQRSFLPGTGSSGSDDDSDDEPLASLVSNRGTSSTSELNTSLSDYGGTPGRPRRDRKVPAKLLDEPPPPPALPGKRRGGGVKVLVKGLNVQTSSTNLDTGWDEQGESQEEEEEEEETPEQDGEDEEEEEEEEEESEGWQSEDDPEKLWCICRQPHNNRFMICCDKCEDWFHGNCVGVTRAMGAAMEERSQDWVCPLCKRKARQREAAEKEARQREVTERQVASLAQQQAREVGAAPRRPGRRVPQQALPPRCAATKCENISRPGSAYCSHQCSRRHAPPPPAKPERQPQELTGGKAVQPPPPPRPSPPTKTAPAAVRPALQLPQKMEEPTPQPPRTPQTPQPPPRPAKVVKDFQSMLDQGTPISIQFINPSSAGSRLAGPIAKTPSQLSSKMATTGPAKMAAVSAGVEGTPASGPSRPAQLSPSNTAEKPPSVPPGVGPAAGSGAATPVKLPPAASRATGGLAPVSKPVGTVLTKPAAPAGPVTPRPAPMVKPAAPVSVQPSPTAATAEKPSVMIEAPKLSTVKAEGGHVPKVPAAVVAPKVPTTAAVQGDMSGKSAAAPAGKKTLPPDARVIVLEPHTGTLLTGPKAPTVANLKVWLQENPTFQVLKPGMLPVSKFYGKTASAVPSGSSSGPRIKVIRPGPAGGPTKITVGSAAAAAAGEKAPAPLPRPTPAQTLHKPRSPVRKQSADSQVRKSSLEVRRSSLVTSPTHRAASLEDATAHRQRRRSSDYNPHDDEKEDKKKRKKKMREPEPEPKDQRVVDTKRLRANVRKTLCDVLYCRSHSDKNNTGARTMIQIQKLVEEIEEELFSLHKDVNFKYKSKYRSFIFNLKDTKNKGLYRKVLLREIEPARLVTMTADELASRELAEWREREEKKELEAIEKHEMDMISLGNKFVMKTHKGEQVIEKDDDLKLMEDKNKTAGEDLLSPSEEDPMRTALGMLGDQTARHDHHVYDQACLICTGKLPAPAPKKSQKSSSSSHSKSSSSKSKSASSSKSSSKSSVRWSDEHKSSSSSSKSRHRDSGEERHSSSSSSSRHRSHHSSSSKHSSSKHSSSKHSSSKHSRDRDSDSSRRKDSSSSKSSRDRDESRHKYRRRDKDARDDKNERGDEKRRSSNKHNETSRKSTNSTTNVKDEEKSSASPLREEAPVKDSATASPSGPEDTDSRVAAPSRDNESKKVHHGLSTDMRKRHPSRDSRDQERRKRRRSSEQERPVSGEREDEEALSDRDKEISSTVNIRTPPHTQSEEADPPRAKPKPSSVWRGFISMPDICKFFTQAFEVSGNSSNLALDIPDRVEVVGRIAPDTIWGYIRQVKKSNKEVVVVRLQPATDEEKLHYASLYSYLSKKNRLGVVGGFSKAIKDFYILPLASTEPVPSVLLPFCGPGLDDLRQHMLLGLILYASSNSSRKRKHESAARAEQDKQSRTVSPPAVQTRDLKPLTIGYQPERSAYQPGHYVRDVSAPVSPQAPAPPTGPTGSSAKPAAAPSTSSPAGSGTSAPATVEPFTFNFYQPAKRLSESEPETDGESELRVDTQAAPPSPESFAIPGLGGNDEMRSSGLPEFLRVDTIVSASADNEAYDPGAATPPLDEQEDDYTDTVITRQDDAGDDPYDPEQALADEEDDEPYDPGAATPPLGGDPIAEDPARLLAELNRRIAQQKSEIQRVMETAADDGDAPYDPADPPDVMDSLRSRTEELSRLQDPIIATYGNRGYEDEEDDPAPAAQHHQEPLHRAEVPVDPVKVSEEKPTPPEEPKPPSPPQIRPSDPRSARSKGNLASLTDSDLIAKAQAQLATFDPQVPPPAGAGAPFSVSQPYQSMGPSAGPYGLPGGWGRPPPRMGYGPPRPQHPGLCVQPPRMFPPVRHHHDPRRRRF